MSSASTSAASALSVATSNSSSSSGPNSNGFATPTARRPSFSSLQPPPSIPRENDMIENDLYVEYLRDLRMNYEYATEKVKIFDNFYNLLEPGSMFLGVDVFVMDCIKKGYTIQWADAAFRAADVDHKGALNKFEYLFAVVSLQADERFIKNSRWIELRRRLMFTYYDRGSQNSITESDFLEMLRDLSTTNEEPEAFGISNKKWSGSLSQTSQHGGHDVAGLGQVSAYRSIC
jgi:hypothetical protein